METRHKAARMRKLIAEHMVKSWQTSPKCDYLMQVEADALIAFRKNFNAQADQKLTYLHLVMKAAAIALQAFPLVNSSYDFEAHEHILKDQINIGFALPVENGLMVLNVKNVDQLALGQIAKETTRLLDASEKKALSLDDMTGGSLTINNMGPYTRLIQHTAIIYQPELAILSMYRIQETALVKNGQIRICQTMNLMLSADHRVIDGKLACEFLARIVELLENPDQLIKGD